MGKIPALHPFGLSKRNSFHAASTFRDDPAQLCFWCFRLRADRRGLFVRIHPDIILLVKFPPLLYNVKYCWHNRVEPSGTGCVIIGFKGDFYEKKFP